MRTNSWQRLLNRLLGPPTDELVGCWTMYDDGSGFLALNGWSLTFHPDGSGEYAHWSSFREDDEPDPSFHFRWRRVGPQQVELRAGGSPAAEVISYRVDETLGSYNSWTERLVEVGPAAEAGRPAGFWFLHEPLFRPWHPRRALLGLLGR